MMNLRVAWKPMIKQILKFLFLFLFFLIFPSLDLQAYQRIISLKPNITEILFSLGLEDEIIAVTRYCDFPKQAQQKEKVADFIQIDVERIIALKPDLILSSKENSVKKSYRLLKERGLEIHFFDFGNFENTLKSIRDISALLKRKQQADKLIHDLESRLASLQTQNSNSKKRVLFLVGHYPLMAAGSDNYFSEAARWLNIENVTGETQLKYIKLTTEHLVTLKPDIIFDLSMGKEKYAELKRLNYFQSVPAVKNNKIYKLPIELFRGSFRLVEGYERIASYLLQ